MTSVQQPGVQAEHRDEPIGRLKSGLQRWVVVDAEVPA